jgi:hypothetical protein
LFDSGRRLAAGAATRPNDKSLVLQFECRLFVDLPAFIDPLANGHVAPIPVVRVTTIGRLTSTQSGNPDPCGIVRLRVAHET